ncbi:MAG TPA: sigma 54-interacting transcriptional regulator [Longimicrobiaceae bacterium]|nr:sigma 54-interacting transcriptional regulator [Longimicrobiaceae bacterium]
MTRSGELRVIRGGPPAPRHDFHGMIGRSPAMRAVYERIERFSALPIPVLVLGETGTGKEMVAQAIRELSGADRRYVPVNCAAIAKDLFESELFGHEPGAFTGAIRRHAGILAQADGGILFLDEVGELPLATQAKLLRVLESGEYRPVGGEQARRASFRLVAATNQDLALRVEQGTFRLDLLHRLGAARIVVPPLRERAEDVPAMAEEFLRRIREARGWGPAWFSPEAAALLRGAGWGGNVRELRNVVEAAAAVAPAGCIEADHLREFLPGAGGPAAPGALPTLAEILRTAERSAIQEALRRAEGNRDRAAALLGVSVATLYRRLSGRREGAA